MGALVSVSGLEHLLVEKYLLNNLTRNAFDITRLTLLEKCEAKFFLVRILAWCREIRHC